MDGIQPRKMVTLTYSMKSRLPDGTIQEHAEDRMRFVYGVERQVPSIERAIEGRGIGERLALTVPSSEIYGEHDPGLVVEIPKKGLIKQRLKEGQFYRQMKMGSLLSFKTIEIRDETVLADFNRPMAGIEVSVEMEILDVREATPDEIREAAEAEGKRRIGCG